MGYLRKNKKILLFASAFIFIFSIVVLWTFPSDESIKTATSEDASTLPGVTTLVSPTFTSAVMTTSPAKASTSTTASTLVKDSETTAIDEPTETTARSSKETNLQDASAPQCVDNTWRLAFEDNFQNGLDKWDLYDSPGHAGNGYRRPSALQTADGNLVITARQGTDGQTVSGGMSAKHTQKFGRYEARVRTEADPSGVTSGVVLTWPAGADGTPAGYPAGGENDFYETSEEPRDRNEFYTFIHMPDISNGPIRNVATGQTETILRHNSSATKWHHMAMEWQDNEIKIFRDGIYVGLATDPTVVPDVAHYLTLQLDAKNSNSMGSTVVRMYVDWVRIYERADC